MTDADERAATIVALEKARETLIEHGWHRDGAWAADALGHTVAIDSPDVAAVCVVGAVYRGNGLAERDLDAPGGVPDPVDAAVDLLYSTLEDIHQTSGLTTWNDSADIEKADVVGLVDHAIADLRLQVSA